MKNKEDLIYSLIFSELSDYDIDISDYIKDKYKYDRFIKEIKRILIKSEVNLVKDVVDANIESVKWKLKIDRCSK
jgi:dihydroneopterin aldolase